MSKDKGKSSQQRKTLAVIPAYNEEKTISDVISNIKKHVPFIDILVVDDGSTDSTEVIAEKMKARVVRLPFNLGIGGAVQTGLMYAAMNNYDVAIQVDADGQHEPREINKFLKELEKDDADVVIGSRFIELAGDKSTYVRRVGIKILSLVLRLLTGCKVTDPTSGFRAANRQAIRFLSEIYPVDYPEPESIVILCRAGFRIKEIPISMSPRQGGTSSINSVNAVYYMLKVLLAILVNLFRDQAIKRRSHL